MRPGVGGENYLSQGRRLEKGRLYKGWVCPLQIPLFETMLPHQPSYIATKQAEASKRTKNSKADEERISDELFDRECVELHKPLYK